MQRLLSLCFLSSILFASCGGDSVQLVVGNQAGRVEHFRVESDLRIVSGPDTLPSSTGARLVALFRDSVLASYDDGSGRHAVIMDSVSYSSPDRSIEECHHIGRVLASRDFSYKIARDAIMEHLDLPGGIPGMEGADFDLGRTLLKIQPVLPAGAVHEGATWERQSMLDSGVVVYKWFRLEDIFHRGDARMARLQMNLRYRLDKIPASMVASPEGVFLLGSGEAVYDVDHGRLESAQVEITGRLDVLEPGRSAYPVQVRQVLSLRREGDG